VINQMVRNHDCPLQFSGSTKYERMRGSDPSDPPLIPGKLNLVAIAVLSSNSLLTMTTMKAVRFHGNQDLRLDEVPVAKVGPEQVKIAPEWCGICGSGSNCRN